MNSADSLRRVFGMTPLTPDVDFIIWFSKLYNGNPAIQKDQITLTADNFKRAMKQAYIAGRNHK